MATYERQAVLEHCVSRFRERFDEMAYALCVEAGKPINDARGEVTRLIDTFKIAAEETTRFDGELQTRRDAFEKVRRMGIVVLDMLELDEEWRISSRTRDGHHEVAQALWDFFQKNSCNKITRRAVREIMLENQISKRA